MARFDFTRFPVNTLIGSRWDNFKAITKGREMDERYRGLFNRTRFVCRLLSSFQPFEDRLYRKRSALVEMEDDPVFILGHWRSGTTFLHNVLAQDRQFAYNTTYQTVFPNLVMWGQPLFKYVLSRIMPDRRPTDNMELSADQPQEEEFALANIMPYSYYNFWFFPNDVLEYCEKYLLFKGITDSELDIFKKEFVRLIKTSMYNTGGTRFLSKNPPHTGRVPQLLKIFPNAKFIYLMRNPYTVFESTRNFFCNTIKPLKFQEFTSEKMEHTILEVYKKLYVKYESDKNIIPECNLLEVKFEDFESDPLSITEVIYDRLKIAGFEKASSSIVDYINAKKGYRKNRYSYDPATVDIVNKHWGFVFDRWGYELK